MHCFHLVVRCAVLSNSAALFLQCVHYRLNRAEKCTRLHLCGISDLGCCSCVVCQIGIAAAVRHVRFGLLPQLKQTTFVW